MSNFRESQVLLGKEQESFTRILDQSTATTSSPKSSYYTTSVIIRGSNS